MDSTFLIKFQLEELQPETTYFVNNVAAVFAGGEKLVRFAPSESIEFTTRKRYAYKMVEYIYFEGFNGLFSRRPLFSEILVRGD